MIEGLMTGLADLIDAKTPKIVAIIPHAAGRKD